MKEKENRTTEKGERAMEERENRGTEKRPRAMEERENRETEKGEKPREKKDNSHKTWATGKKASMKRRCEPHNYNERGIYMLTLCTEGRRPLLGTLKGNPDEKEGPDSPNVELSALGWEVLACWKNIPTFFPAIRLLKLCIMPDHIHGVLFVTEKMERHLGHVVNGFKVGTRKAAMRLGVIAAPVAQPTGQDGLRPHSKHSEHGVLWEPGYNDRILQRKGQLERMLAYLDDNPRRLLIKRKHPEFFTRLGTVQTAGMAMEGMGNRFLLDNPIKIQVQCSRSLYPQEIEQQKESLLQQAADNGAVVVSPCISPGERQIATAALSEGLPLIVLLLNGFPPFFKPQPRYLEACSEGRLLMLAPYPFQNEKIDHMRQRCLQLNSLASAICHN